MRGVEAHGLTASSKRAAPRRCRATCTAANLPKLESNILNRVTTGGGFDENSRSNPGLLKKLMDHGPADLGARFVDGLSMHMMNTQSARVMGAESEAEQNEIMQNSPRVQQLALYLSELAGRGAQRNDRADQRGL